MLQAAMLGIALGLGALLAGLAVVAYGRTRRAASIFARIIEYMDRSTRRVGAFALVPGAVVAARLIHRGLDPVAAIVVGALSAFGVFAVALAILRMEGMLTESESAAALRVAAGRPPTSTRFGRIVAAVVGVACIAAGLVALQVASRSL